jgi:uncharacterized protein YbjT (DUF2867 family)
VPVKIFSTVRMASSAAMPSVQTDTSDDLGGGRRVAFVAGATGYTGRALVPALRDAGWDVVAHVRPDSSRLAFFASEFGAVGAEVDVTAWDVAAFTARFTALKPTAVFALLGTTRARSRREGKAGVDPANNSYEAVDYRLNRILLDAAVEAGNHPRFLYLSAVGAESAGGAYMAVRRRLEGEIRASGLPCTLVRPSFISGDDREDSRPAERVAARLSGGLFRALAAVGVSGPRDRWSPMTAAELADAMVRALANPRGHVDVREVSDLL